MWKRVAWIDTASFTIGAFGKIFVTRTAKEKYNYNCLVPKFAGYLSAIPCVPKNPCFVTFPI